MAQYQDKKSAFKLAQLYRAVSDGYCKKIIERILVSLVLVSGDMNFAIPLKSSRPHLISSTALHFALNDMDLFIKTLKLGADFTIKNDQGQTTLHMITELSCIISAENVKIRPDNPFVNSVLSAHVNLNNFSNPCNKDGLSHFHIACMTNHTKAVQFFLDNGISVDESVSKESKMYSGYTPMHFAADYANTKVAELLLMHGANMHAVEAREMTPLHLLIECRIKMYDSVSHATCVGGDFYEKLQEQIAENEIIINLLLENMSSDNDCVDSIGLSNFHIACMLQDTSVAQQLADRVADLDQCVNMDSRLWPGYTALHFAVHANIKTVEMLLSKGGNIMAKDCKGVTPLDICIKQYKTEDVCNLLSLNDSWRDILFSDGQTKLLSFIRTLSSRSHFEKLVNSSIVNINMSIPMESTLWPGYTPFHLAILFLKESKKEVDTQIIRLCLNCGANLIHQDTQGQTALHLAFRLNKMNAVEIILRHCSLIPNIFDAENLTHFHIVCAATKSKSTFGKCVVNSLEVNASFQGTSSIDSVRPGSTPLHALLAEPREKKDINDMVQILLKIGADPCVKDAYGLTPIHWLLGQRPLFYMKLLLQHASDNCVVEEYGLSYLHVACYVNDDIAVKRFLENGANVNLAIKYPQRDEDHPLSFLSDYDKCTPLMISSDSLSNPEIMSMLIDNGADLFAKKIDGSTVLSSQVVLRHFIAKVWNNVDLQNRMKQEFGWTKLHLACYLHRVDGFQDLVKRELANVNARVFSSSPVWKGYTPLHLPMLTYCKENSNTLDKAYTMLKILLENGADVTVTDDQQNTPLNILFSNYMNQNVHRQAALLMKYHKDFNVNPVNSQGISHFHIACYLNDVDAVKGFLSHGAGVDVNHPIDYFAEWNPGFTPLHLASQFQVMDVLINHGANVLIEDVLGSTVLTHVIERDAFNENVVSKLIKAGANVNSLNLRGQTPFEILISKGPITKEQLFFCIEKGFLVNSCNPISGVGYLAIAMKPYYRNELLRSHIIEAITNQQSTGILGRTTLHYSVSLCDSRVPTNDYIVLFEKLNKSGHNIDEQDIEGKTALHLAVEFRNENAVKGLLESGVDINIVDMNGKSALSYVSTSDYIRRSIRQILNIHAFQLVSLNLDISQINVIVTYNLRNDIPNLAKHAFFEQIAATKKMNLGVQSMRLYDFLSETGAVTVYPLLIELERNKIDQYFGTIDSVTSLTNIKGLLKLQYRKALERTELLSLSTYSFRMLLRFDLTYLCVKRIFLYLSNSELKNIISAGIEER